MTKYIWNCINKQAWSIPWKQRVFLVCSVLVFCAVGTVAWGLIGSWFLRDSIWLVCFIGYFGFYGFLKAVWHLY